MFLSLIALMTLGQVPPLPPPLAPVVGPEVAAVARLDLDRLDVGELARAMLGNLAGAEVVQGPVGIVDGVIKPMKEAGVRSVYLVIDPGDMPGYPVVALIPADGADARRIIGLLTAPPLGLPAARITRGVVVAGPPATLDRIEAARPSLRPDLAAALAEGKDAPIRLALAPSRTIRQAVEETVATLPPELGGGPIDPLTQMQWGSLAIDAGPKPMLRILLKARGTDSADKLGGLVQAGLQQAARAVGQDPAAAPLAKAVGELRPEVAGDRVALTVDLGAATDLAAIPVGQFAEATQRTQSVNNLKTLGLALHNYHSVRDTFPPAALSKAGKPLLSWRVLILPFLDEQKLFEQFRLDEPWDSEHNRPLVAKMPQVFNSPRARAALAAEGKTTYLAPRSPQTIITGSEGIKIRDITDGTSNTVMVVEAGDDRAATWTRPDDWEIGAEPRIADLLGHYNQGTNALFGDGSVRFLKGTLDATTWKALLTRNGGEVISADRF